MESDQVIDPTAAARLIDEAGSMQRAVAERAAAPRGELVHYAASVVALVAGGALGGGYERTGNIVLGVLGLTAFGASLGLLVSYVARFRARTGIWVTGMRPPRARWVAWLVVPVIGGLFVAAYSAAASGHGGWAALAALSALPAMVTMSRWWEHEYLRGTGGADA